MRLADPRPGFCSSCFAASPERRFIDIEADYDGAPVLDRETQTIAVLPWNGQLGSHDNAYFCEVCVDEMRKLLGMEEYKEVLRRQAKAIQRLEVLADMERDGRKRAEADRDEWRRKFEEANSFDQFNPAPRRRMKAAA